MTDKPPFTVHNEYTGHKYNCPYSNNDYECSCLSMREHRECFFFREYQDDDNKIVWYCERVASEEMDFKRKARETMFYEKDDDV
jgi:hypothetical protein